MEPNKVSSGKRQLESTNEISNKKARVSEADLEDEFLYGNDDSMNDSRDRSVNCDTNVINMQERTLVKEGLPTTALHFITHVFETMHGDEKSKTEETRMKDIMKTLPDVHVIPNAEGIQIAFLPSLWLEVHRRMKEIPPRTELIHCFVYMRRLIQESNFIELRCFSLSDVKKKPIFSNGQLVQVNVLQAGQNPRSEEMIGYVSSTVRRLTEPSIRTEQVMVKRKYIAKGIDKLLIEEMELIVPYRSILKEEYKISLRLNPLCYFQDIIHEVQGLMNISQLPLFHFLESPGSSVTPSGLPISCNAQKFNSQQLEAMQRSLDLLLEPAVDVTNPPFNGIVIKGDPHLVRGTLLESLCEFIKNPTTSDLQFVVVSECMLSLNMMLTWLRKKLRYLKLKDTLLVGGKDSIREQFYYAGQYVNNEITQVEKRLQEIQSKTQAEDIRQFVKEREELEIKKQVLSRTVEYLESNGSLSVTSNIVTTASEFMKFSFGYQLKSARVILSSFGQIVEHPALVGHLKTKKVYGVPSENTTPYIVQHNEKSFQEENRKHKNMLSHCVILDAESMPDSRAIAFFNDFSFKKLIACSAWISQTNPCKRPSIASSFLHRLTTASARKLKSMIIDVTGVGETVHPDVEGNFLD